MASRPTANTARRPRKDPHTPCLHLERVLGLSTTTPAGLATHPAPDVPIVAYPAGGVVTLYNHRRNRQVGFLVSASASANSAAGSEAAGSVALAGALPNSSNGRKVSAAAAVKQVSCVAFSRDGAFLAAGEAGHQPRIVVWNFKNGNIVSELHGHKFGVLSAAFSPGDKVMVSVGFQHDGYVYVWNWRNGQKLAHNRISTRIFSIAFEDTGSFFVTTGFRHFKFWYYDSNALLSSRPPKNAKSQIQVIEGKFGIVGEHKNSSFVDVKCGRGNNDEILTYSITDKGILVLFTEDRVMEKWVDLKVSAGKCMAITDRFIVCGCSDGIIRLFETISLKYITTLPKPHHLGVDVALGVGPSYKVENRPGLTCPDVVSVAVDGSGEKIVCTYNDASIYIWDVKDTKHVGKYRSSLFHNDCVWGIDVLPPLLNPKAGAGQETGPDAEHQLKLPAGTFISYSSDSTIRFWNLDTEHLTSIASEPAPSTRRNIYSKELLKIIYIDNDYASDFVKQRANSEDSVESPILPANGGKCVRSLCVNSDGTLMASGDRLGNIRVHDLRSFQEVRFMEVHDAEVLAIDFSKPKFDDSNCAVFLATAGRDRLIHVFDVKKSFQLMQTLDDHSSSITALRFSDNGKKLMSSAADKSIVFRSLNENSMRSELPEFSSFHNAIGRATVFDIDVDASQSLVAAVSQDRRLNLFSTESGKPIRSYRPDPVDDPGPEGSPGALIKVSIDPSGCFAVTSGSDRCIRVFDLASGACVAKVVGHSELVTGVRFSNSCQNVISSGADGCILVWRVAEDLARFMTDRLALREGRHGSQDLTSNGREQSVSEPGTPHALPVGGFVFGFDDSELPSWARRTREPSAETEDNVSSMIRNGQVSANPTRGRWATRVGDEGVKLFSDVAEEDAPVAKFSDLFSRRFSLETIPPPLAPTDVEKDTGQKDIGGVVTADDVVIQDLESTLDEPAETSDDGDSDDAASEAPLFAETDVGTAIAAFGGDGFEITEKSATVDGADTSTEERSQPQLDDDIRGGITSESESGGDTAVTGTSIGNADISLEEYLLQPIDASSLRQSMTAKHFTARRPASRERPLQQTGEAYDNMLNAVVDRLLEQQANFEALINSPVEPAVTEETPRASSKRGGVDIIRSTSSSPIPAFTGDEDGDDESSEMTERATTLAHVRTPSAVNRDAILAVAGTMAVGNDFTPSGGSDLAEKLQSVTNQPVSESVLVDVARMREATTSVAQALRALRSRGEGQGTLATEAEKALSEIALLAKEALSADPSTGVERAALERYSEALVALVRQKLNVRQQEGE